MAYATALMGDVPLFNLLSPPFLTIFGSLIFIAIYASIINDLTDLEIDIACNKANMMELLSGPVRWLLAISSLGLVFTTTIFIYPNRYAIIFYLLITLSISLYSFPPIRLKKRGIWGVIACASAEHLFPTLFAITIVFYASSISTDWWWLIVAGAVSFLYGVRSILWHQFLDRDNDQKTGINTFANKVSPEQFIWNARGIMVVELVTLAIVLYLINLWIVYISLILYTCFILLRQFEFKSKIIFIVSPTSQHFQILMLDFYTIFFPLSLLVYTSWTQPYGWVVLVIHILLFHKTLITTGKDVYCLMKNIVRHLSVFLSKTI
ncbi:MAG: UbiA family prenyltransferase [Candidatus Pedobacter colombiensis]|uniref:UbiA family prenyltransferase n=1 Tax=Candidatus Pedobacter colombiensis TaxID=3121371 RepID=A0AAJ6B8B6_9SPHI|nr:UbiA family prenyltransferase [Pedobacter sp.]WEK21225.1 MAG: UbiA family prenyltransferase [Pedobacter sp.]